MHTLENGLRIVVEQMPEVSSAAAGFLVRTGARDETPALAGVSHFLEHMCFKGTQKRDWRRISVSFDELGSTYNAFTSEDRTFYFGWLPTDAIKDQIELLADMMRPTLPQEEFATEKKVILEEIAMSKDSLDHVAFDFVLERVFEGHPLAWPILGYERTVGDLTRDRLHAYFEQRYAPDNMMLVVAGSVEPDHILDAADELCGHWKPSGTSHQRATPNIRSGKANQKLERFNQQIVVLSFPAPGAGDPLDESAHAAVSILGGQNSRIEWNIMQAGLSHQAGAYRLAMGDCGLTVLFGQTDPDGIESLADALRKEARDICRNKVSDSEVQRVKNKRRTTLAVEGESPYHRIVQIMDDVDYRGAPRTMEQRLTAVEAVTADSVAEFFERCPIGGEGYLIGVGPRDWPADN